MAPEWGGAGILLIGFLLGFENHYLLGRMIFIDGGSDAIMRLDLV